MTGELLTVKEYAARQGMTEQAAYKQIRAGKLTTVERQENGKPKKYIFCPMDPEEAAAAPAPDPRGEEPAEREQLPRAADQTAAGRGEDPRSPAAATTRVQRRNTPAKKNGSRARVFILERAGRGRETRTESTRIHARSCSQTLPLSLRACPIRAQIPERAACPEWTQASPKEA